MSIAIDQKVLQLEQQLNTLREDFIKLQAQVNALVQEKKVLHVNRK